MNTRGAGSVVIDAAAGGRVEFTAPDAYTGGTTLQSGTLELGTGGSIIFGHGTFADAGTAEYRQWRRLGLGGKHGFLLCTFRLRCVPLLSDRLRCGV